MKINKNFEGENADTTIDDTSSSSTFLLCEMFHFNCIQNMSATYSMAYSQPLYWIIVLKPGWLVMSRFPYNVKSVPIECRRNANNKQNQQSTIQLPFFSGFDVEFVDFI